jgi:hypothetical protein
LPDGDDAGGELADGDEADRLLPETDHPHARTVPTADGVAPYRQAAMVTVAANATDSNSP